MFVRSLRCKKRAITARTGDNEERKAMMNKILKRAALVFFLFVAYAVVTAVLPYAFERKLSKEFTESVKVSDFYGDAPCIDRVALVEAPIESLGARMHLVAAARERLDVAYYAIEAGESTDYFLAAILDAADRGVKVRLLFDGISNGLSGRNASAGNAIGCHPNVELRYYNPVKLLAPWTYNGRMHDKYMIIDDRLLLLGGRNIGDKYFGPENFAQNLSIDRDVLVFNTAEGTEDHSSALFSVRSYMDRIWSSASIKQYKMSLTEAGKAEGERLRGLMRDARARFPELFDNSTDYYAQTVEANKVTFFANDINITRKEPRVAYMLGELLRSAQKQVLLQSPYIVLDQRLETLFHDLGEKGVSFSLLTNSRGSTPNMPAYAAYLGDRDRILASGASVYEFQSRHAIHAKTYLIDDRLSVVGSFNLDPRSARIDTELMLAIDSEAFSDRLTRTVEEYKARSLLVGADGAYAPGQPVAEQPVGMVKQVMLTLLRLPVRLIKFLI